MSASVLGCGHTSHLKLFEIDIVIQSPQIHLHFWTSREEYEELGYAKVELCCHGCGTAELVYYIEDDANDRHLRLRNEFASKHAKCQNRNYQSMCPDWRTSFRVIDIRREAPIRSTDVDPFSPFRHKRGTGRSMFIQKPVPRAKPKEDT